MFFYAVIFHGRSLYYFGGTDENHNDLNSILRLDSGSWTWSNVGQINSARNGHEVILVGEKVMVVGGAGTKNNEACLLMVNGHFNCTELSSNLTDYALYPILFAVAENYESC